MLSEDWKGGHVHWKRKLSAEIAVVFPYYKPGTPSWPYINYNFRKRADEVMEILRESFPDVRFKEYFFSSREEVDQSRLADHRFDGILVYMVSGMWTGVGDAVDGSPISQRRSSRGLS